MSGSTVPACWAVRDSAPMPGSATADSGVGIGGVT